MVGCRFRIAAFALVLVAGVLTANRAHAHWCDDNWGSAYNLVVRPEQDQVTVPGTLNVYVQNNIGEALKNFTLNATASGYSISISGQNGVRAGWLMPGEKLRYTLTITGSGTLTVESLVFTVSFGDGGQSSAYGGLANGRDAVTRKTTGDVLPATKSAITTSYKDGQGLHLQRAAYADYTNMATGLDQLIQQYCSGRSSWEAGSSTGTDCSGAVVGPCPGSRVPNDAGTKYDYQKLWAGQEAAARFSQMTAGQLSVFRQNLECGYDYGSVDPIPTFRHFALFLLGYLGADSGVRTFLLDVASTAASDDDKLIAKAALLLHGNAADYTAHHAAVVAGLGGGFHVSAVCAAVLGIIDGDDAAVIDHLLPKVDWIEPDTSDDGQALFAAHLIHMVAWERRGYAPNAGDSGDVSFYSGVPSDTTPPAAPGGVSCTASPGGTIRVAWNQVTQDTAGHTENVTQYRVYSGNEARSSGCTAPGCATDYAHNDSVNGSTFRLDLPSLDGAQTYYFAVMAVDAAGNTSQYSTEVHCVPVYAPTAVIQCSPTSGDAPLDVTCNATSSSDPNGAADIKSKTFSLDGQAAQAGDTVSYSFAVAANHVVLLRVTDQGDLTDADQVTITVTSAGNTAPTAVAGATPLTGQAPLQVVFSSAGSSDPDSGQTISYAWDFQDGETSTEASPTHTFAAAGVYDVLLTVTDDAPTPASGFAVVTVDVRGNNPPDVSTASATPLFGDVPLTVHFDATGVTDPDGNAVTLAWDFGDGSAVSTQATVDHVYPTAGAVTARLTATDDYTPPASATRSFVINPGGGPLQNQAPDCAAATVSPAAGGAPLTVTLDASGCTDPEGNGMTFLWRIPTSLTTEDQIEEATGAYVFEEDGEVTITLRVTDDASPSMSTTREFVVAVGAGGVGRELTGCVCTATGGVARGGLGLFALAAAALALGLRRRRR